MNIFSQRHFLTTSMHRAARNYSASSVPKSASRICVNLAAWAHLCLSSMFGRISDCSWWERVILQSSLRCWHVVVHLEALQCLTGVCLGNTRVMQRMSQVL